MADTKELRKFKKGIRLGALASPPNNAEKGAMYIDNSGKLFIHNGTDFEEVVDKTTAQTLENKSIDADNNTISNIEVDNLKSGVLDTDISTTSASDDTIPSAKAAKSYVDSSIVTERDTASTLSNKTFSDPITLDHETTPATPASGKVKVYAKNDNKLHILDSNGAESSIGSSSGGSLDTFHTEDFTTLQTSSINETSGKYSLDILNAGISKKTLKVTIDNSCTTGDKIVFPTINLNERQKGQTCSISFYYKTENEGGGTPYDEKIDVIVATDSGFTNTILVSNLKDSGSIKKFVDTFTIPSGTTNLYYGFKCNATLPNGVFYVDDIEFSQDPFVQSNLGSTNPHIITPAKSNLTDWVSYTPTVKADSATLANHDYFAKYRRVGDSMEVSFSITTKASWTGNEQSGTLKFYIPNGSGTGDPTHTIDTNKLPSTVTPRASGFSGSAMFFDNMSNHIYGDLIVVRGGDNYVTFAGEYPSLASQGGVVTDSKTTGVFAVSEFVDGASFSGTFTVPITGWGAQDSNFLAALPMTKWQKKALTANVTSDHTIFHSVTNNEDFRFQNLSIGKSYRLNCFFSIQNLNNLSGDGNVEIEIWQGSSTLLGTLKHDVNDINAAIEETMTFESIFEVTSSSNNEIYFKTDMINASDTIIASESTATIEELPMHEKVNIW